MMITCKEFARMASRGMDQRLPVMMRIKFKLHLLMCRACARYKTQLGIIRRLMETVAPGFDDAEVSESEELSEQTKRKIIHSIDEESSRTR